MAYQGWKNYETWNISLWVNNEEGSYRAMMRARPFNAASAEALCRAMFPNGTPDMKISDSNENLSFFAARTRMNLVDWQEIADSFNAD